MTFGTDTLLGDMPLEGGSHPGPGQRVVQQPFGFFRQNFVSEYTYPQSVADRVSGQRSILIAKVTPLLCHKRGDLWATG
jgi:hypothetical protein